jgi:hypothetical protein
MTIEEAEVLITNWHHAVSKLWSQVTDKARQGMVSAPLLSGEIGGIKIIMSVRGIEVVIGSIGSSFKALLTTPTFSLSEFPNLRKFVVDSIRKAHIDVDKAIEDRGSAFDTCFNDFKKEIAEYNLTCPQGKELK